MLYAVPNFEAVWVYMQALYNGVPQIFVPLLAEQPWNALVRGQHVRRPGFCYNRHGTLGFSCCRHPGALQEAKIAGFASILAQMKALATSVYGTDVSSIHTSMIYQMTYLPHTFLMLSICRFVYQ